MMCKRLGLPLLIGFLLAGCSKCPTLPEPGSNRTVLAELFSFAGCTYCPNAEEAMRRLKSEYGDSLAVVVYHMRMLGDTLSPEDAQARAQWYGVSAAPTSFFDGGSKFVGAGTVEHAYNNYRDIIVTRRSVASPLEMSVEASLTQSAIEIDCEVVVLNEISGSLKLWLVVFQNSVHLDDAEYDFVVRWIEERSISLSRSDTVWATFNLSNRWPNGELGAIAFVQDDDTKSVLQAVVEEMSSPSVQYSFELVGLDDISRSASADTERVFSLALLSTGSLTDVYRLSLAVVDAIQGSFHNPCFRGVCVVPPVVGIHTLSAGASDSTNSIHVMPMDSSGLGVVRFQAQSPADTTLVSTVTLYIKEDEASYPAESDHSSFRNRMTRRPERETLSSGIEISKRFKMNRSQKDSLLHSVISDSLGIGDPQLRI